MAIALIAGYLVFGLVFVVFLDGLIRLTQAEGQGLPVIGAAVFTAFWPIVLGWMAWRLRALIRQHQPAGRGGNLDSTREDSPLPRWPLPRSESPVDWN